MRRLVVVVAVVLWMSAAAAEAQEPIVRNSFTITPRTHVVVKKHFVPEAEPTVAEVHEIGAFEQKLWGGPSLMGRIYCESSFQWWQTTGAYRGLLQIGPWWETTAWERTPRKVVVKSERKRQAPVRRIKIWSDGRRQRTVLYRVWQHVRVRKVGRLPADATPYHGWAAIRVGQRAVSGDGPTTAWSCGL